MTKRFDHVNYIGTFNGHTVRGNVYNTPSTAIHYSADAAAAAVYRHVSGGKQLSRRRKEWSVYQDTKQPGTVYALTLGKYGSRDWDKIEFCLIYVDE